MIKLNSPDRQQGSYLSEEIVLCCCTNAKTRPSANKGWQPNIIQTDGFRLFPANQWSPSPKLINELQESLTVEVAGLSTPIESVLNTTY